MDVFNQIEVQMIMSDLANHYTTVLPHTEKLLNTILFRHTDNEDISWDLTVGYICGGSHEFSIDKNWQFDKTQIQ